MPPRPSSRTIRYLPSRICPGASEGNGCSPAHGPRAGQLPFFDGCDPPQYRHATEAEYQDSAGLSGLRVKQEARSSRKTSWPWRLFAARASVRTSISSTWPSCGPRPPPELLLAGYPRVALAGERRLRVDGGGIDEGLEDRARLAVARWAAIATAPENAQPRGVGRTVRVRTE